MYLRLSLPFSSKCSLFLSHCLLLHVSKVDKRTPIYWRVLNSFSGCQEVFDFRSHEFLKMYIKSSSYHCNIIVILLSYHHQNIIISTVYRPDITIISSYLYRFLNHNWNAIICTYSAIRVAMQYSVQILQSELKLNYMYKFYNHK